MAKKKISENVQIGEKLVRLSYLTVVDPKRYMGNNQFGIHVKNEHGFEWTISPDVIDNECTSGVQFDSIEKVSQSVIIEYLLDAGHKIFTANFNKKPDPKVAIKKLQALYPNKGIKGVGIAKRDDYNKSVEEAVDILFKGEERTITGRIISVDRLRGRVTVVDLDKEGRDNIRQIDPRTLNWLIIDNIKYVVK